MTSSLFRRHAIYTGIALALAPLFAHAEPAAIEEINVYGEPGKTDTATKLDLTIFETPQTITAISRAQLDEFNLTTINDVLNYTPGVTVEEVETDRTYYTARGFDIVNFQYDGLGIPFIGGINLGQQDTAIYEKVEVVKGAAGLITGLANPSATINYVRKRPTEEFQGSTALTLSQWQGRRVDADISGSLTERVRGRIVGAYDDSESYLDRHQDETKLGYGIIEADLSDTTLLTLGHSYDRSHSQGVLWGALPLTYTDGSATDYDVSTSNSPDWTFAITEQTQSFVELKQLIGERWSFNAVYTANKSDYESELFYVYGTPDADTEIGLFGWASAYDRVEKQQNMDAYFSGDFDVAGRNVMLVAGYSHSDTELTEASYSDPVNGFPVLGSDWAQGNTGELNFTSHNPATDASDIDLTQKSFYFAARVEIVERVSALLGVRDSEMEQTGISYGGDAFTEADHTAPYFGLTYQVLDDLMLYGSYNEVFKQQAFVNADLRPLGPTIGESEELGLKKSFADGRAVLTVAWFSSEQENFGEFIGRNENGIAIYQGSKLSSDGFEVELTGELFDGFNIATGFTKVDIEDDNGNQARPFIPTEQFTLSGSYSIPALQGLKVGGVLKWQSDTTTDGDLAEQDAFTLLDLALNYQINDSIGLSLNLNNVTDEKYYNSLYWTQAYYGAPRNVSAGVSWSF